MSKQAEALQHQMQARATARILGSSDWISAEEMARLGHRSSRNAGALARSWRKKGVIFSIRQDGESLYPVYALDPLAGNRPLAGLGRVLKALGGDNANAWAMAFWFDSPNSYLGGRRPKDCLAGPLDELLLAAHAEAQGVQHG